MAALAARNVANQDGVYELFSRRLAINCLTPALTSKTDGGIWADILRNLDALP